MDRLSVPFLLFYIIESKITTMKNSVLLVLLFLLLACSQNEKSEGSKMQKPKTEDPNTFDVDAAAGAVIQTDKGSRITIPENAFVNENGEPLKGLVQIRFEEFHDFADIASSGISMFYDSAGVRSDLRSGGMFRIAGSQNGESIQIAEGKELGVDLTSINDTPCYNFYKQEENGKWNYLHTSNGVKPDSLQGLNLPNNPSNQDLSNALSIDIDYTDIPELNMYRSLIWRYVGDKIPRVMTSFNHKTAKIVPVEGVFMTYELIIQKQGKTYKMKIQPILTGKDLDLAISKYQHTIEQMQMDPNSIYYKPKMVRNVTIDGFGTYNWDVKNKRGEDQVSFPLLAKIDGKEPADIRISLISFTENIVVNYDKSNFSEFSFDPNSKNLLIAFYEGDQIAVLHPSKVKDLAKFNGKKEYIPVDFKSTNKKKASSKDLKQLICELMQS